MTRVVQPTVTQSPQPAGLKHRFHAMIKPTGSLCNLDSTYCYYPHQERLLHQPRQPRMSISPEAAGIVPGTRVPIILTSRAHSPIARIARLASCAVATRVATRVTNTRRNGPAKVSG